MLVCIWLDVAQHGQYLNDWNSGVWAELEALSSGCAPLCQNTNATPKNCLHQAFKNLAIPKIYV